MAAIECLNVCVFGFSVWDILQQGEVILLCDYIQAPDIRPIWF